MKDLKVKYYNNLLNENAELAITSLLNEDEVIVNMLSEKINSKQKEINKVVAKILSDQFGDGFGNYLNKKLTKRRFLNKVNLIVLLRQYQEKPSDDLYDKIFAILNEHLVGYFVSRTIGWRNDIKKFIPFKKNVGTGNFKVDMALYNIVLEVLNSDEFSNVAKRHLKNYIDGKLDELYNDSEYKKLLEEGLLVNLIRKWTGGERRARINLLSFIYKNLPKLNRRLKRKIRNYVFENVPASKAISLNSSKKQLSYKQKATSIANIVSGVIVEDFVEQMAESKILRKEKELEPFYVITLKALKDSAVKNIFKKELDEIIMVKILNQQEKEKAKEK